MKTRTVAYEIHATRKTKVRSGATHHRSVRRVLSAIFALPGEKTPVAMCLGSVLSHKIGPTRARPPPIVPPGVPGDATGVKARPYDRARRPFLCGAPAEGTSVSACPPQLPARPA